jgi:hypothetical protein
VSDKKTVRIQCTIEPRVHGSYTEVIELDESEFEGMTPQQRKAAISRAAEDWASEQCPWGFEELDGES